MERTVPRGIGVLALSTVGAMLLSGCMSAGVTAASPASPAVQKSTVDLPMVDVSPSTAQRSTAQPSTAQPSTAQPAKLSVPDSAFAEPPPKYANNQKVGRPYDSGNVLPSLCGARFASDKQILDRRGRYNVLYPIGSNADSLPDSTVVQTIAIYRPGGAEAMMRQTRAAVAACPHDMRNGAHLAYTLLTPIHRGDDDLLVQELWTAPPGTTFVPTSSLFFVSRAGDVLTMLEVAGWEGWPPNVAIANDYVGDAIAALHRWLHK